MVRVINVIEAGLVKRKKKNVNGDDSMDGELERKMKNNGNKGNRQKAANGVNVLGAGLVRKKMKA